MLNFKEGQIYICTKSDKAWWTVGKEYPVVLESNGLPVIRDDDGQNRYSSDLFSPKFELVKYDKTPLIDLDLNKLTLEELDEYLQLATALQEAESELNNFIERMTK